MGDGWELRFWRGREMEGGEWRVESRDVEMVTLKKNQGKGR